MGHAEPITPRSLLEHEMLLKPIILNVDDPGDLPRGTRQIVIQRNDNLRLEITATGVSEFPSWSSKTELKKGEMVPASKPIIGKAEFDDIFGKVSAEFHILHSRVMSYNIKDSGEFTNTGLAFEAEAIFKYEDHQKPVRHVEWIINWNYDDYFPVGSTVRRIDDKFTRDRGDSRMVVLPLPISLQNSTSRTSRDHIIINLNIKNEPWEITIGKPEDGHTDPKLYPGFIEFNGPGEQLIEESIKDKIIDSISFVLGRDLISIGWTQFDANWRPYHTFSCVPATVTPIESFSNPGIPPCKLGHNEHPFVDSNIISNIVQIVFNALMDYPDLDYSIWLLWLAKSSVLDAAAAHYGSAIESLRKSYITKNTPLSPFIVKKEIWEPIKIQLQEALNTAISLAKPTPSLSDQTMLSNKIVGINSKSSNAQYPELFSQLSLPVGEVEYDALKERNKPAHGTRYSPERYASLSATLYAMTSLYHRILLKISGYKGQYIDYSTFDHPNRDLGSLLGGPRGDGKSKLNT